MDHRSRVAILSRTFGMAASVILAGMIVSQTVRAQDRGYIPPSQQGGGGYGGDSGPRPLSPPPRSQNNDNPGYGQPYSAPPPQKEYYNREGPGDDNYGPPNDRSYSSNEIVDAGHRFFGDISEGLAKVVEYAFKRNGRPVGYILGEEGGGAVIAGLRYGEGTLHTKMSSPRKVYWQGPSIGYDFGANGSKTLTLVYNMRDPSQIYDRFSGIEGAAYFIGGVGITFQTNDVLTLAPIRAGVGLRLGANVGYLKYTPSPTWNPF